MKLLQPTDPEPLWKDEFSINAADDRYVTRRQFTKFLVLTSLGMFVGNLWILAKSLLRKAPSYTPVVIGKAGEVPVGAVKIFSYPGPEDPCILVRLAEDRFVAYTQKCTHLSCAGLYHFVGRLDAETRDLPSAVPAQPLMPAAAITPWVTRFWKIR